MSVRGDELRLRQLTLETLELTSQLSGLVKAFLAQLIVTRKRDEMATQQNTFFSRLLSTLPLVPVIVAGIEQTAKDSSGATKKQMALNWLRLAAGATEAIVPEQTQIVEIVGQALSTVIDAVVKGANEAGDFTHAQNGKNAVTKVVKGQ